MLESIPAIMSSLSLNDFLLGKSSIVEQLDNNSYTGHIPLLNYVLLQDIPDGTLVRFRGMIQDMFDTEIYLERYVVRSIVSGEERLQDGRYRDTLVMTDKEDVHFDAPNNVQGERRSLFLVSIPGINEWAADIEKTDSMGKDGASSASTSIKVSLGVKRHLVESDAMENENVLKKIDLKDTIQMDVAPTSGLSAEYLLNSPLPDRPGKACIAKVYSDFDNFALNSLVEVTGFLSVDPALDASLHEPTEHEMLAEIQAANPPPSLIPRIHCIHIHPLAHTNPMLPTHNPGFALPESYNETYKDIQLALTQCLFGDTVASTYLMCYLISSVYVRSELQTLGQLSLNLSYIPNSVLPEYTNQLYEVLEQMLPVSHFLPLTLDNLNTLQFNPKKDYKTNKLTSGILQLAPHTHLVLDETKLEAGRLENAGVEAVASIAHLINLQKLKSNFEYYQIEFNADVPVLVLSEGKSMLPSNCHVPLKPEPENVSLINETFKAVKHFLQTKLIAIRTLLTMLKLATFSMDAVDRKMIPDEFVEMRRLDPKAGPDDLHAMLVLARYLGICQGRQVLDAEIWQQAKALEAERKSRLIERKK